MNQYPFVKSKKEVTFIRCLWCAVVVGFGFFIVYAVRLFIMMPTINPY